MSLYDMVFTKNPMGDVLLYTLGLMPEDVGRYRDTFISEGTLAVYTRNGGGNRKCFHGDGDVSNSMSDAFPGCKQHVERVTRHEVEHTPIAGGLTFMRPTGRMVEEDVNVCDAPNSTECGCPGCIITHRLPKHPLYLRDVDDAFDRTYATIYFRFPPEFEQIYKDLDIHPPFDPSKRWREALDEVQKADKLDPKWEGLGELFKRSGGT